jgi:hypothetical protein
LKKKEKLKRHKKLIQSKREREHLSYLLNIPISRMIGGSDMVTTDVNKLA